MSASRQEPGGPLRAADIASGKEGVHENDAGQISVREFVDNSAIISGPVLGTARYHA